MLGYVDDLSVGAIRIPAVKKLLAATAGLPRPLPTIANAEADWLARSRGKAIPRPILWRVCLELP